MVATVIAITTHNLTILIAASALQGVGTGVGGVMARTLPRDLYQGTQLRHANSLLNMGILVSPSAGAADWWPARYDVVLACLLRFPAGAVRNCDLQHGAVDAGNPPNGRATHPPYHQL